MWGCVSAILPLLVPLWGWGGAVGGRAARLPCISISLCLSVCQFLSAIVSLFCLGLTLCPSLESPFVFLGCVLGFVALCPSVSIPLSVSVCLSLPAPSVLCVPPCPSLCPVASQCPAPVPRGPSGSLLLSRDPVSPFPEGEADSILLAPHRADCGESTLHPPALGWEPGPPVTVAPDPTPTQLRVQWSSMSPRESRSRWKKGSERPVTHQSGSQQSSILRGVSPAWAEPCHLCGKRALSPLVPFPPNGRTNIV